MIIKKRNITKEVKVYLKEVRKFRATYRWLVVKWKGKEYRVLAEINV